MEADISNLRKTGHFYFALTPFHNSHTRGHQPFTTRSFSREMADLEKLDGKAAAAKQDCQRRTSDPASGDQYIGHSCAFLNIRLLATSRVARLNRIGRSSVANFAACLTHENDIEFDLQLVLHFNRTARNAHGSHAEVTLLERRCSSVMSIF
jgi:hypothetical protein